MVSGTPGLSEKIVAKKREMYQKQGKPYTREMEIADLKSGQSAFGRNLLISENMQGLQTRMNDTLKKIQTIAADVPPEYQALAVDPSDQWEQLMKKPEVVKAIDESPAAAMTYGRMQKSLAGTIAAIRQEFQSLSKQQQDLYQLQREGEGGGSLPSFGASPQGNDPNAAGAQMRQQLFPGK